MMDERTTVAHLRDWRGPDDEPDPDVEFWREAPDDDTEIHEQFRSRVYLNARGDRVIRQQRWPDEDDILVISRDSVRRFAVSVVEVTREIEREFARRSGQLDLFIGARGAGDEDDEWREPIAAHLAGKTRTTVADIGDMLGMEPTAIGTSARRRIGEVLTSLGFEPRRDRNGRWWERDVPDVTRHAIAAMTSPQNIAACSRPNPVNRSTM